MSRLPLELLQVNLNPGILYIDGDNLETIDFQLVSRLVRVSSAIREASDRIALTFPNLRSLDRELTELFSLSSSLSFPVNAETVLPDVAVSDADQNLHKVVTLFDNLTSLFRDSIAALSSLQSRISQIEVLRDYAYEQEKEANFLQRLDELEFGVANLNPKLIWLNDRYQKTRSNLIDAESLCCSTQLLLGQSNNISHTLTQQVIDLRNVLSNLSGVLCRLDSSLAATGSEIKHLRDYKIGGYYDTIKSFASRTNTMACEFGNIGKEGVLVQAVLEMNVGVVNQLEAKVEGGLLLAGENIEIEELSTGKVRITSKLAYGPRKAPDRQCPDKIPEWSISLPPSNQALPADPPKCPTCPECPAPPAPTPCPTPAPCPPPVINVPPDPYKVTKPVDCASAVTPGQWLWNLYRMFFNRDPDAEGQAYWESKLRAGDSNFKIIHAFMGSTEHLNVKFNNGASNEGWVESCYCAMARRASDAPGKAYWVGNLVKGDSREKVLYYMLQAPEYRNLFNLGASGNARIDVLWTDYGRAVPS